MALSFLFLIVFGKLRRMAPVVPGQAVRLYFPIIPFFENG